MDLACGYHILQLQYRAFHLGPGLVSQWCRARNDFRCPGYCFLIRMFGSPNDTLTVPLPFFTYT